jgi:hypothetical protein
METFVIRVFVAADTQRLPLTGLVEYVSNGRRETFEGGAELLEIVRRELKLADAKEKEES